MPNAKQRPSRRRFLRAVGAVGLAGATGCLGGVVGTDAEPVSVLAAGSLQHALETTFRPAVGAPVRVEAHGSATAARLVAEGRRDPDVVAVADTALFEGPLSPPWHSVFTSNAVVLAYNPDTDGGRRVAEAGREGWYEPLVDGGVRLGRTDPEQDPLGYRTLFALDLATRYYDDAPDLRERVLARDQIYPETGLVSQFETGSIDAAFAYRNMAVERGYDYVELPAQVNLSSPAHADEWYASVSHELPSGQVVRGAPISYGATLRSDRTAAVAVFAALTTGDYLADAGFLTRESFPRYEGDPPEAVVAAAPGAT